MTNKPLRINTPDWLLPLLKPNRYKGLKGGRGSGKSHAFAEMLVLEHYKNPNFRTVCVREVQRSLKFSSKQLIEDKIESLGLSSCFEITLNEIRDKRGKGVIVFNGLMDHTADSIKSLEGFNLAWVEEAQSISKRSLELLLPTIRMAGSEIWFSWNPNQPDDPIEQLKSEMTLVHVNYTDNPFCPDLIKQEADMWLSRDPEGHAHIWLGNYQTRSDDQVLAGRYTVSQFEVQANWDGPYFGADWGFSIDPTTLVKSYIHDNKLYIADELYQAGIEINDTPAFFDKMTGARDYVIRADNARPEIISYMQSHGYPKIKAAEKWQGSVNDGVSKLRGFDKIVIHPRCTHAIDEARLWKYKRNRLGDILPELQKGNDHIFDGVRYSLTPLIREQTGLDDLRKMVGMI